MAWDWAHHWLASLELCSFTLPASANTDWLPTLLLTGLFKIVNYNPKTWKKTQRKTNPNFQEETNRLESMANVQRNEEWRFYSCTIKSNFRSAPNEISWKLPAGMIFIGHVGWCTTRVRLSVSLSLSFVFSDLGAFSGKARGGMSVREGQGVVLMCIPPPHSPGTVVILLFLWENPSTLFWNHSFLG